MAELVGGAFLSATLQVAFERLASPEILNYFRGRKLKDGLLKKLHITLISINQVLEDAEERQYRNPNVKQWLDELKDAVFKAEDLLDEITTEALQQKMETELQATKSKVQNFLTTLVSPFDKEIESRIIEVLENLEFLAKQKDVLGLKEGFGAVSEIEVGRRLSNKLRTTSLIDESIVYGRDVDKEEIFQILLSHDRSGNQLSVHVITISGMGGVGKTTLAQLLYNDKRMEDHFQLRAWVCVSEEFNVVLVTKAILEALHCLKDSNDLNLLQLQLKERLMENKFFLVLDDVWNENRTSWEILQAPFNYGAQGSKILVTTRNKKVALVMHSTHIHHLKPLAEEDCWKLFAKHAFHDQHNATDSNLVSIGRKIVKKCGGLPLAIKTLGSLLRTEIFSQEWFKILESDMWHLSEDDSNIIPALRLSYHYLPLNLKRCFAYCSNFPKDYEIDKAILIQLWMAEGLLRSYHKDQSMEEVGNEFFNDLQSRAFFEPSRCSNGRYFIMHDLLNDLAKSIMGEFCFRLEGDYAQDIPIKARYFSYLSTYYLKFINFEPIFKCNQLRSFMPLKLNNSIGCDVMDNLLSRLAALKYLRVLSFCGYKNVKHLVDDISNLKHLRYLDISFTSIKKLPNSMCSLINLQTLKLVNCCFLTELPPDLHKLINLRYLDLSGTSIKKMPNYMGKLKHLHTLTRFVVGKRRGSDMKELGKLNLLRGTISILMLDNAIDPTDTKEANMKEKKYLEELMLEWCESSQDSQRERCLLDSLQPNSNLKRLTINHYNGTRFPDWFEASYLPNLVSLQLSGSSYCFCLPPLGQLPSLKELRIYRFIEIEVIGPEFYGDSSLSVPFRSLECLTLSHMKQWEEWNLCCEGESFPCLQELRIWNCPKMTKSLPQFLPSLKMLNINNCENLEASLPKASSMDQLTLSNCKKISLQDVPTSLTCLSISEIGEDQCSLNHILLTNPNLEQLHLSSCDELVSFSIGGTGFSNLKLNSIFFDRMSNLKSLPENMRTLFPSLHSLTLWDCPELESLPQGGLPASLVDLAIMCCPKLLASRKDWGLQMLHSLRHLSLSGDLENVESFPEEALLPPNLTSLTMKNFSNLKSINYKGLLHLKSLESLFIWDCPRLSLKGLPDEGLPKSLSRLEIWGNCPLLKQGCQKEKGQDWPKISHIPHLWIC